MTVDTRVMDLLERWDELREQGDAVTPEILCNDCPELLDEVKRRIRDLESVQDFLSTDPESTGNDGTVDDDHAPILGTASRYKSLRFYDRGGLGEVYVAEDLELRREVALKRMNPNRSSDPASRRRFLLEAEVTGQLEHPGVVPVHGLIQDADGNPCYAMRFIRGETLQRAIEQFHNSDESEKSESGRRRLAFRQLLTRFVAVCNTLAYAHSRGIVHRDLKPANIMLGAYGETLVVDWGLAKTGFGGISSGTPPETAGPVSEDVTLGTETGLAMGTPAYMSPEQALGEWDKVGPASDIFGLGTILYALLTGHAPYQGLQDMGAVRLGHYVSPRQVKKDAPAALEAICLNAMAPRAEDRYGTAQALAQDVEQWLADEPVAAFVEPITVKARRWARKHRALVTGAAALLFTGFIALVAGLFFVDQERRQTTKERDDKDKALQSETQARTLAMNSLRKLTNDVVQQQMARRTQLTVEDRKFLRDIQRQYEEFAALPGDDVEQRAIRAEGFQRMAQMQHYLGAKKDAEASFEQALTRFQQLVQEVPFQPEFRFALAATHHSRGTLFREAGRMKDAEMANSSACAIFHQLTADFPTVAQYRDALAGTHNNLGSLFRETGRLQEAEVSYREALTLRKHLAADTPTIPKHREELASAYSNLGRLLRVTGRPADAEVVYTEALTLLIRLASDIPGVPDYSNALAQAYNNMGVLLKTTGRPQDAEDSFRKAVALHKQLAADFPTIPEYRWKLAASQVNLGLELSETARTEDAEVAYREALTLQKQLVANFPKSPEYVASLGLTHMNLGVLFGDGGRLEDAEAAFRQALGLGKQLVTDFAAVPDYQNFVAVILIKLADLDNRRGLSRTARELVMEAVPYNQAALSDNPRHPYYREYWRNNRGALTVAHIGLNDHASASVTAADLVQAAVEPAKDCYSAAACLAQCIPLADQDTKLSESERKRLAQSYADRAVETLRKAVENGYKDLSQLKSAKDLDPVRERDDFKKLLEEMEAKSQTEKEAKP